jgi:hypothetical protein
MNAVPQQVPQAVYCQCTDHRKHVVIDAIYPVSLKRLHHILYGDKDSRFMRMFMESIKGFSELEIGAWNMDKALGTRRIEYRLQPKLSLSTHFYTL